MLENGWYTEMQEMDSLEYLSWSKIMAMHKSEKNFYRKYILGKRSKDTPQMRMGRIIHSAMLEPEKFREHYRRAPVKDEIDDLIDTVKDLKEALDHEDTSYNKSAKKIDLIDALLEQNSAYRDRIWDCIMQDFENSLTKDSIRIDNDAGDKIIEMTRSLLEHPLAPKLMKGSAVEANGYLYDKDLDIYWLIKPDIFKVTKNKVMITDYKSTADASGESFGKSTANFGYHIQAAMYIDIAERILGRTVDEYSFVITEQGEPYTTEVKHLNGADIELGRQIYTTEAQRIVKCLREHKKGTKKYWSGYSGKVSSSEVIMPRYYINKITNDSRYFL